MAESHISLLAVRKIVRTFNHAAGSCYTGDEPGLLQLAEKEADQIGGSNTVPSEWACQFANRSSLPFFLLFF